MEKTKTNRKFAHFGDTYRDEKTKSEQSKTEKTGKIKCKILAPWRRGYHYCATLFY